MNGLIRLWVRHLMISGYIALHLHFNNQAMGITYPDRKVQYLLMCFLNELQEKQATMIRVTLLNNLIKTSHREIDKIINLLEQGNIEAASAEKQVDTYNNIAIQALQELEDGQT